MKITNFVPTLIFGGIATLTIAAFVPGSALAGTDYSAGNAGTSANPGVAQLLNKANAINYEEIQMADVTENKAGDNQALMTFAKTLKADHQANEDALAALARQENVHIEHTPASMSQKLDQMKQLNGSQFDSAMLNGEVKDHQKALSFFENEKAKFHNNPNVAMYVEETIPVLRAHLQMAKTLQQHIGEASNENPTNNKSASR
jgi:putative membrane protein